MGIDISHKQKWQESGGHNIRQNRLKTKSTKKDKEGHYIVIKRSIQEEDITLVNMLLYGKTSTIL